MLRGERSKKGGRGGGGGGGGEVGRGGGGGAEQIVKTGGEEPRGLRWRGASQSHVGGNASPSKTNQCHLYVSTSAAAAVCTHARTHTPTIWSNS